MRIDVSSILLNQFTGYKLRSDFHDEHVNSLRYMNTVSDKKT